MAALLVKEVVILARVSKPKIMLLSDSPLTVTGYANQGMNILNRLKGYEKHYQAHNYIGQSLVPGLEFEDGKKLDFYIHGNGAQPYSQDILTPRIREHSIDVFGILLDTFMTYPWLLNVDLAPAKTFFYFPTDGENQMPTGCENILRKVHYPICMSKFGQEQVQKKYGIKCYHIPHGVDSKQFFPLTPIKKKQLRQDKIVYMLSNRQLLGIKGGLVDKFVIGIVARNQGRKMLDRTFKAMAVLKDKVPNAVLYFHSDPLDAAAVFDMESVIKEYGLQNRVYFSGMRYYKGFTHKEMNNVYNLMDTFFLSCFHPDTQITTNKGFKNIKDIEIGDEVLTIDSSFKKVEDKVSYEYDKKILNVSTSYCPDVKVTPNHFVYGVTEKKGNYPKIEYKSIEKFKEGDYLIIPRIKNTRDKKYIVFDNSYISNQFGKTKILHPNTIPLHPTKIDNDFMWLAGIYVAEGCLSQKKEKPEGIVFCINSKEKEYTNRILKIMLDKFNLSGRVKDDTRHRRTIWFNSASLGRKFKELFGSGAKNKKIPEWMLFLPKSKQINLVQGYLDGDGHYAIKEKLYTSWEVDTVSKNLAHHMRLILIRLGYLVSYKTQQRQSLVHRLRFAVNNKNSIGWMDKNYFYIRIKKIRKEKYKGLVYDLSVQDNHNYCNYWLGANTSGEGFGIPIIEAMSAGIPPVVTNYTTTQELLLDNGKCGEAVELVGESGEHTNLVNNNLCNGTILGNWGVERGVCNFNDAAKKLQHLAENPILVKQYAKEGRKKVLRLYDWKVVMKQWDGMFKKILED